MNNINNDTMSLVNKALIVSKESNETNSKNIFEI